MGGGERQGAEEGGGGGMCVGKCNAEYYGLDSRREWLAFSFAYFWGRL